MTTASPSTPWIYGILDFCNVRVHSSGLAARCVVDKFKDLMAYEPMSENRIETLTDHIPVIHME